MVRRQAGDHLSFVNATGSGCLIHRETTGRYVVSHAAMPDGALHAATLAGAYAACCGLDAVIRKRANSES
jgi:hypothetical protein